VVIEGGAEIAARIEPGSGRQRRPPSREVLHARCSCILAGAEPHGRAVGRRAGVSERGGARNERDAQRRELEAAGWELVERGGGKTIWRNPQSGGLYPQSVAITMVREGPSPKLTDETPGEAG
jgi:hypothetical protein